MSRPLQQSSTSIVAPVLRQQSSVPDTSEDTQGLTEEELVALVTHHRGSSRGLAGQNRKRLLVLLKYYEDQEKIRLPIEAVFSTSRSQDMLIKRERDEEPTTGRKRSRPEVITRDDQERALKVSRDQIEVMPSQCPLEDESAHACTTLHRYMESCGKAASDDDAVYYCSCKAKQGGVDKAIRNAMQHQRPCKEIQNTRAK
ncbi:hypothetical protein ST47_g3640 [Ascochyta rabiei]|uniref:Uncharacterized protein n=1 Tax=Didymella rabiei TaxID=5454 RepID=A0A163HBS4_DIDRA|nr:hypothetical protein ST47_g3640 [Ascochyta rabiei]